MKKKLMTILMLLCFSLSAIFAVVPTSRHVGRVNVLPLSGSITARALEAVGEELDADWFETWTTAEKAIIDFWSDELLSLLPLENVIAGEEKDNAVSLYDLEKQVKISFTFNEEGLITSLDIEH